jgi:hypothetical protein
MFKCTVKGCEATAKTLSGLSSHIKNRHPDLDWEETKKSMQQTAPKETQTEQLTEDMVKRIAKEVVSMMQTETAEPQTEKPLPKGITPLPMEEVEVAGDRINFQFPLLGLAL